MAHAVTATQFGRLVHWEVVVHAYEAFHSDGYVSKGMTTGIPRLTETPPCVL